MQVICSWLPTHIGSLHQNRKDQNGNTEDIDMPNIQAPLQDQLGQDSRIFHHQL